MLSLTYTPPPPRRPPTLVRSPLPFPQVDAMSLQRSLSALLLKDYSRGQPAGEGSSLPPGYVGLNPR